MQYIPVLFKIIVIIIDQAEVLTGVQISDLPTAHDAVVQLQSFQPNSIVLTLGDKGLIFSQSDRQSEEWSKIQHIEAEKVKAIDSTVGYYCRCTCFVNCIGKTIHVLVDQSVYNT